jgi:hypothetical protein
VLHAARLAERAAVLEALKQLPADAAFLAGTFQQERADRDVRLRSLGNCPAKPWDRLDALGLGSDVRLVVAELKRDVAPDTLWTQANGYAAMASRFDDRTPGDEHAPETGLDAPCQ